MQAYATRFPDHCWPSIPLARIPAFLVLANLKLFIESAWHVIRRDRPADRGRGDLRGPDDRLPQCGVLTMCRTPTWDRTPDTGREICDC